MGQTEHDGESDEQQRLRHSADKESQNLKKLSKALLDVGLFSDLF